MMRASPAINPCAWDITLSWDDGELDTVSVRRLDGLAFEHPVWMVADHVRAVMAAKGVDVGRQAAVKSAWILAAPPPQNEQ